MKIVVYHAGYGCDTGCCGHVIESTDDNEQPSSDGFDNPKTHRFEFDHPYGEDHLTWAQDWVRRKFGEEHVKDLDWANCTIIDD